MAEEVDAVDSFEKNNKAKKRKFKDIDEKTTFYLDPKKTKMVIKFNDRESASIKSFAVKNRNEIKITAQFMSGKLLIFTKLYLKSFIYDLIETFCFPQKEIVELYKKYLIEQAEILHIITSTDSTAIPFIFISDPDSDLSEEKFRDIIFEVMVKSKIY